MVSYVGKKNNLRNYVLIGSTIAAIGVGTILYNNHKIDIRDNSLNEIVTEAFEKDSGLASKMIIDADSYIRKNDLELSDEAYKVMFLRTSERMSMQPELIYHLPDEAKEMLKKEIRAEYELKFKEYFNRIKETATDQGKRLKNIVGEIKDYVLGKIGGE